MYKTPITLKKHATANHHWYEDASGLVLHADHAARDLTAYYELLARQRKCGETGHLPVSLGGVSTKAYDFCCKCGADLTKGVNND